MRHSLLAVLGIERGDVAAHAELTTGAADDDLALDNQRHQGHILTLPVVLHLGVPQDLAGLGVERDNVVVGGGEIELVLPQADAAIGRMQLEQIVGELPLVAPIFVAVLASIAITCPIGVVTNMTPLLTSGGASWPSTTPVANVQTGVRFFTFDVLIWSSGL